MTIVYSVDTEIERTQFILAGALWFSINRMDIANLALNIDNCCLFSVLELTKRSEKDLTLDIYY